MDLEEYLKGGADNEHKQLREGYGHIPKPQARKIKEDNIQKEVKSYIDNYPPDIPISKIPEKYRSDIQKFLFEQKKIYSDAVKARVNMTAGSDEYQEQTDIMNGSLQSVNNLKNQWNAFGQGKEENLGDIDGKTYVSLDTEDMHETVSKILKANKSKLEREKNLAISIPDDYIDDPLVDED